MRGDIIPTFNNVSICPILTSPLQGKGKQISDNKAVFYDVFM